MKVLYHAREWGAQYALALQWSIAKLTDREPKQSLFLTIFQVEILSF